jgi:hypothetical protein
MQFGHNDPAPLNDDKRARGTIKGTGEETEAIDNLLTGSPRSCTPTAGICGTEHPRGEGGGRDAGRGFTRAAQDLARRQDRAQRGRQLRRLGAASSRGGRRSFH